MVKPRISVANISGVISSGSSSSRQISESRQARKEDQMPFSGIKLLTRGSSKTQGNDAKPEWEAGWRGGLAVNSADCSSREPGVDSQHPHSGSKPSITPILLCLLAFLGISHTHKQNTHTHKIKPLKRKKKGVCV